MDTPSAPLKPAVLHILLALAASPLHGYGILTAVRESTNDRLHLETGPLYRHLKRLIDSGLVRERPRPRGHDPRRGTYYELTAAGRRLLRLETERLAGVVAQGRALGLLDAP